MTRHRLKNILKNILKVAFAVALITWLVRSGRFDVQSLKQLLVPEFLITSLIIVGLSTLFISERWRALLQAQGFEQSPVQTFKLTLIGLFFNFAMPGGVGGDLIKGYYVVRSQQHRKFDSAMTILMDRVFGLYIMIAMATGAVVVGFEKVWNHPQLHVLVWIVGFLFFSASTGLAVGFSARAKVFAEKLLPKSQLTHRIFQIWQSLLTYRHSPGCLFKVGLYSLFAQLIYVGFFIRAGNQLGFASLDSSIYFISCLVGTMITAIPISPAGIGVGQAAFGFLFSELGGPAFSTLGAGLATASQGFQFLWGLLGSVFYIQMKTHPKS
jgi:uncharacterized protein (TIRG00374 family)